MFVSAGQRLGADDLRSKPGGGSGTEWTENAVDIQQQQWMIARWTGIRLERSQRLSCSSVGVAGALFGGRRGQSSRVVVRWSHYVDQASDSILVHRTIGEGGEAELEAVRRAKVEAARDAGASWEQVGEALGVSRQSAWEYYSSAVRSKLAASVEANADLSEAEAMDLAVEEVRAVRRRRRKS
jgi:hypothetical protein